MNTPLTQLLVHLDATPQAVGRLETACRIAQQRGAAVNALYAVLSALVVLPYTPVGGGAVAAPLSDIDAERRDSTRARFDAVARTAGVPLTWSEVCDATLIAPFAQQALFADLMVLGQHDPTSSNDSGVPPDFPESVLAASGRPALILPFVGAPAQIGETVVIAWKPTRESARAVAGALPLLQQAKRVHVLSWSEPDERILGDPLNLRGYLRQHGVEASWHRERNETGNAGELLLSRAFDLEAALLVMGCYGHGRAREWVLGGASRTVLHSMTLPVLMAH